MANRSSSRHREGQAGRQQMLDTVRARATAFRLAATKPPGLLQDALVAFSGEGAQEVARHPRLSFNEDTMGCSKLIGRGVVEAVLREHPHLRTGQEPPAEVVKFVGGLGDYYMHLEECIDTIDQAGEA